MALCVKTGACVLIEEYNSYLVCDIHEINEYDGTPPIYILYAISQPQFEQPRPLTHRVTIGRGWFKNRDGSEVTLVVPAANLKDLAYD